MQKIYSLLRSNKQSGPYSLEELLQLNLQPFDLVWVEGKSAGWSYPTEIESLKWHVTEAPKPIEKKETPTSVEPTSPPAAPNERTIPSRLNSKHIYISLPSGKQFISEEAVTNEIVNSLEESPEAKLERKAEELRNKIQGVADKKNAPKAEDELDIKYTRSLDDIKEEYSSWLYQQRKKRKHFPVKYVAVAIIGSILMFGAFYFFPNFSAKKHKQNAVLVTHDIDTSSRSIDNDLPQALPKKRSFKANSIKAKIQKNVYPAKPARIYTNEEMDKVDAYLDSLKDASEKQAMEDNETVPLQTAIENNGTRQSTKRNIETTSSNDDDSTPFSELLKLSESAGNGTSYLRLYNNSNKYIKFVAVDAYYYKANQKLLEKKTFYFNNISPKSSARLYVPQEKKAASVKYQMGLISTDNGLYYASQ